MQDGSDASVAAVDASRQWPQLAEAVRALPSRDREALPLHVWEDLTYTEVTEVLS